MATNTGKGSRKGSVSERTHVGNPASGDYVKRNEDPKSSHGGKFMAIRKEGIPFKGVAKELTGHRGDAIAVKLVGSSTRIKEGHRKYTAEELCDADDAKFFNSFLPKKGS